MSRLGDWLKPAALFGAAAVALRAERRLLRREERLRERRETGQAIDERTAEEAEAQLPDPTIWPVMLALAVAFGLWGIVLHTFFFGIGLLLAIVSLAGWANLLFHEKPPYHEITPTEDPQSR